MCPTEGRERSLSGTGGTGSGIVAAVGVADTRVQPVHEVFSAGAAAHPTLPPASRRVNYATSQCVWPTVRRNAACAERLPPIRRTGRGAHRPPCPHPAEIPCGSWSVGIPGECLICDKHRGLGRPAGPVLFAGDSVVVTHRPLTEGSPIPGYLFVETRRHAPALPDPTDAEAVAVGWAVRRVTAGAPAGVGVLGGHRPRRRALSPARLHQATRYARHGALVRCRLLGGCPAHRRRRAEGTVRAPVGVFRQVAGSG